MCNECFEPELYANSTPDIGPGNGWAESWADEEWDPEELAAVPDLEAV